VRHTGLAAFNVHDKSVPCSTFIADVSVLFAAATDQDECRPIMDRLHIVACTEPFLPPLNDRDLFLSFVNKFGGAREAVGREKNFTRWSGR
jgi:hypothetical protein